MKKLAMRAYHKASRAIVSRPSFGWEDNRSFFLLNVARLQTEMSSKRAHVRRSYGPVGIDLEFRPKSHEGRALSRGVLPISRATQDGATVNFIRQLAQGIDLSETDLFSEVMKGMHHLRYIWEGSQSQTMALTPTTIIAYRDKILEGLEFTRRHGVLPQEQRNGPSSHDGSKRDYDVGLAIIRGRLYYYRTGHHRLGYALATGVRHVPCSLLLWDRQFEELSSSDRSDVLTDSPLSVW